MVWRHVTKLYANYIQIPSSGLKSALLVHYNRKTRQYKSNIFPYWFFCSDHYCSLSIFHSFLGAFSKLRTATISFVMSVCASIRPSFRLHETTRLSLWTNFHEVWYLGLNPLNPELNPIFYLLALLGAHHFLHVSRIRVKLLTFRLLMSYIYGAPILDVSRSHTTTQHSR